MRKLFTGALSALLLTAGLGLHPATVAPVAAFGTCLSNDAPKLVLNAFAFAIVNGQHSQLQEREVNPDIHQKYTMVAPGGKETILWSGTDAEIPDADSMLFDVWGVAPGRYSIKELWGSSKLSDRESVVLTCIVKGDATPDTRFGFSVEGRGQYPNEYARMPRCKRGGPGYDLVLDANTKLVIDAKRQTVVTVTSHDSEWCTNRAVKVNGGGKSVSLSLPAGAVKSVTVTMAKATPGVNSAWKSLIKPTGKRSSLISIRLLKTAATRKP